MIHQIWYVCLAGLLVMCTGALEGDPAANQAGREWEITYTISPTIWDPALDKAVETPPAIISKVNRICEMYSSVPESGLRLVYAGLAPRSYTSFSDVPRVMKTLNIILGGTFDIGDVAGLGGHGGTIPDDYYIGNVIIPTKTIGLQSLGMATLIHEIGHAVGLAHAATNSSYMFIGSHAWGWEEYLHLTEQDRLDLARLWPARDVPTYVVTGSVIGVPGRCENYGVYVVDVVTGHTYSAMTRGSPDGSEQFSVTLGGPGDYRVFALLTPSTLGDLPAESPSWYVKDGPAVNDPYAGSVIHIGEEEQGLATGIIIAMIERPSSCTLFWSMPYTRNNPHPGIPTFFLPGSTIDFYLTHGSGEIQKVEAYGSNPDITILEQRRSSQVFTISVALKENALPGERLLIARGAPGQPVQAGLAGIHVVSKQPDLVPDDARVTGFEDRIRYQIENDYDFSGLQPDFYPILRPTAYRRLLAAFTNRSTHLKAMRVSFDSKSPYTYVPLLGINQITS